MWLRALADNPLREGGQIATHIDYDDARATTTQLDASILDDPGFRFLLPSNGTNLATRIPADSASPPGQQARPSGSTPDSIPYLFST
jgi:hypothetical protein